MLSLIKRCIPDFLYTIYYGIKNIIEYMPLIYYDRDWDYLFLLELMKYKIGRMEKNTGFNLSPHDMQAPHPLQTRTANLTKKALC